MCHFVKQACNIYYWLLWILKRKCVKHQLELYSKVPVYICGQGYGDISLTDMSYALNINPLNAELNPICCLLALLGAHHFFHISIIRVKSLTLRLLMSYIYIYTHTHIYIYIYIYTHTYMAHPFLMFLDHTQRCSTVGRTPLDE